MPRVAPAERIRLVEAVSSLQRLRREMGRLSETDEDYKKKKQALKAVIKELQSASDGDARSTSSGTRSDAPALNGRSGSLSRSRLKSSSRSARCG